MPHRGASVRMFFLDCSLVESSIPTGVERFDERELIQ
jgi:hypothetical protein